MASYKSNRQNSESNKEEYNKTVAEMHQDKKAEEQESSKKVAKTAAKGAATYFGGPVGGKAVDLATQTKAGDEILNKGGEALNKIPGMGKAAKKLDDSGLVDTADKAIDIAGGMGGGAGAGTGAGATSTGASAGAGAAQGATNAGGSSSNIGGDSSSSLSDGVMDGMLGGKKKKDKEKDENQDQNNEEKQDGKLLDGTIKISMPVKIALMAGGPIILILLILLAVFAALTGSTSDFEDAFGASQVSGGETGGVYFEASSKESAEFYKRINEVKEDFLKDGKNVDALLVVATYHIIHEHNEKITYNSMNKGNIREIADAMFEKDSTSYNADYYQNNLINSIFPKYVKNSSEEERKYMIEEIYDYINRYYDLIGYRPTSSCSAIGSCSYNIKGFYIYGKGNITKELNINNLKVRLMQTGSGNGHNYGGTFGQPLEGEELVDFEKYILGVAYAEIGSGAPEEAIKAQMVAARSYILARSTDMGGWRTLKEENGTWVLQAAASTQDQVYCDPDKGCSSNDGQWGQVHSGLSYTGYQKPPLATDSRLRSIANETMGQVLVNSQGYVIYSGYTSTEQNIFTKLANEGYNYKQILLQVYNSTRNLGASDIESMSCNTSNENCSSAVTGDFASWKQYEGPWISVPLGRSSHTIKSAGCLATSIAMQIARSGVQTNIQGEFNPGTFVEYLNKHGGFIGANFVWGSVSTVAPNFRYVNKIGVSGYSREQKINTLNNLLSQGYYVVAEVKGRTGQHWVAVAGTSGQNVTMMDPGSSSTDMWSRYNWVNTSTYAYFKAN